MITLPPDVETASRYHQIPHQEELTRFLKVIDNKRDKALFP